MLRDVHHRVLKRIVTGLHGNKMYRNASRKQISVPLEKLISLPPVTCLVNDCHNWFSFSCLFVDYFPYNMHNDLKVQCSLVLENENW